MFSRIHAWVIVKILNSISLDVLETAVKYRKAEEKRKQFFKKEVQRISLMWQEVQSNHEALSNQKEVRSAEGSDANPLQEEGK